MNQDTIHELFTGVQQGNCSVDHALNTLPHLPGQSMEDALPAVVSGICSAPVSAVPISVGCGSGFGGTSALSGMLNSCSPELLLAISTTLLQQPAMHPP